MKQGKSHATLASLNKLPWYARLPVKWAIFGLTVLAVCFPYPNRLIRHVRHWRNPNALVEPDAAALRPLIEELRPRLADDPPPREALRRVERFVYEKIRYEWDWNTWGTADYLPTLTEAIEMGKEDCDGRAVVAASLLRNFGFKAELVSDLAHVWVRTDKGETMGPGKTKAVVATEKGLAWRLSALKEVPRALAYGVAVFPIGRELVVIAVSWLLLLSADRGIARHFLLAALLVGGLLFLRAGGSNYGGPNVWLQLVGVFGMGLAPLAAIYWHIRPNRITSSKN